jgi:hypothetical protein
VHAAIVHAIATSGPASVGIKAQPSWEEAATRQQRQHERKQDKSLSSSVSKGCRSRLFKKLLAEDGARRDKASKRDVQSSHRCSSGWWRALHLPAAQRQHRSTQHRRQGACIRWLRASSSIPCERGWARNDSHLCEAAHGSNSNVWLVPRGS